MIMFFLSLKCNLDLAVGHFHLIVKLDVCHSYVALAMGVLLK